MAKYVINSPLQLLDSNGNTVSGGTFKFFEPGASATAKAVFKYVAGSYVSAGTEISTNARGMPEVGGTQILLYGDGDYYVRVFDASAVELEPYEQIEGAGSSGAVATEWTLSELTPTFISATSFSVIGDHRSTFQMNMRVKSSNTGGDMYGKIATSVFTSVTTVTLVNTGSDVLDAGLSSVSTGLLTADNPSYPASLQADLIDGNDNEVLIRGSVASAVNELTVTNAATGNDIAIAATGDDTNVGMDLQTKGTGQFQVNGVAIEETPAFSAYITANYAHTAGNVIQFGTEEFDVTGDYDNTTNYRFTPSVAGKYYVSAKIQNNYSPGVQHAAILRKNGVTQKASNLEAAGATHWDLIYVDAFIDFNGTTDYVDVIFNTTMTLFGNIFNSEFLAFRVQA